jgi:hypothetical protein
MLDEERLFQIFIQLFQQLYRKLGTNPKYKYNRTEKNDLVLTNLIKHIGKTIPLQSIGEDYITSYLTFSFSIAKTMKLPPQFANRKNYIPFTWVIGKTSYNRFIKSSKQQKYVLTQKVKAQNKHIKIQLAPVQTVSPQKLNFIVDLNQNEEYEKQRFKNSLKGYAWCADFTTLYNHKSSICLGCSYNQKCKQRLKENYNKIYTVRGYE